MPRQTVVSLALLVAVASVAPAPGVAGALSQVVAAPVPAVATPGTVSGSTATADAGPAPDVTVDEMTVAVSPSSAPAATPTPGATTSPVTSPDAAPITPHDGTIPAAPDGAGIVQTAPINTAQVQTIGVTWPHGGAGHALRPQVRTKVDDSWSGWEDMPASDIAPDNGTAEAARTRDGTDSLYIAGADAVQIGFAPSGVSVPAVGDVKVALVRSEEPAAGAASPTSAPAVWVAGSGTVRTVAATAGVVNTTMAVPAIVTRAEWGAAPEVCTPAVAATLVGAVIHHTADTNDYTTQAQAEQMIRNDQAYHINSRGWCDLGYNFVVDKWGNIYEGRANSLTQPVIGVHAGGFNTGTVGVAMLGDLSTVAPTAAELDAVARIVGYRLGTYGRNPAGMMTYTTLGGEDSRFAAGTVVQLPVVMGHRDVGYTACPGNLGYAALPWIRARAQRVAYAEPLTRELYADLLQRGPDPAGLAGWSGELLAGVGVSTVADQLGHSTEYVQRRVTDAYTAILHRGPDPTGLAGWTAAIMTGQLHIDDLSSALLQSAEYYLQSGGTPEVFVTSLYNDVLQRGPAAAEVTSWVGVIRVSGRGAAALGVWRSLESARLRVNETYVTFLGRGADPTGLATWAPYWQAYGSNGLQAQIVASDEYLFRSSQRFWSV